MNDVEDFDSFTVINDVYIQEHDLYDNIIDMWNRNDINVGDVNIRAKQVLIAILDNDKVVGVFTRVLGPYNDLFEHQYLYVRIFIDPKYRNIRMLFKLFSSGVNLIQHRNNVDGIVFNTENQKFDRPNYQKRLVKKGFIKLNSDSLTSIWYLPFRL